MATEAAADTPRRAPLRRTGSGALDAALPVAVVVAVIVVLWYVAAVALNAGIVRDGFERAGTAYTTEDLVVATLSQDRPLLPAPHQIVVELKKTVLDVDPTSKRSLVYHGWVTLSSTLLGFVMGTLLGIALAVLIVHMKSLDKSLMPWIISSQTIPILAIAPIVIVVLGSIGLRGLVPKAIISTYLCFFPVTIGMVKGLTSPDVLSLDLMRTYSASKAQTFWKLRLPASVPFLFASLKVAVAIAIVGAIVAELPTGAQAGIGARLLSGSYYGQTVQIWAALFVAAALAASLVALVGLAERVTLAATGGAAMTVTRGRAAAWIVAGALLALSAFLPTGVEVAGTPLLMFAVLRLVIGGLLCAIGATRRLDGPRLAIVFALLVAGCAAALVTVHLPAVAGRADLDFWLGVLGLWIAAWVANDALSAHRFASAGARRAAAIAVPAIFGAFLLFLWEVVVVGFGVSPVLMPPPSAVGARIAGALPILYDDFVQTFVRGVLSGYVIGCGAGFLVAILADRVPFLRKGLLPLGNFVSALPIIGIAPIMVMWFGFDWHSKAAVVVVMTFFPMLVNTVAGLSASGTLERDLMRSYAASWWTTLVKLRLPAALPFIFNALKINSTLALIGAIVAEFFGTPTVGMGFRISIEAGRMALDMVWAEIAVAAVAGTAFYGLVALLERSVTFWHPSYRR